MAYAPKENTGALFKNKDKKEDKHPDYKGSVTIAGADYWQSAWIKKSKDGVTYMSQSFARKDKNTQKKKENEGFDDDIPM